MKAEEFMERKDCEGSIVIYREGRTHNLREYGRRVSPSEVRELYEFDGTADFVILET